MTDQEIEKLFMQYAYHGQIDLTEAKYFAKAILSRAIPEGHVVVPGWLPIESAPKDGRYILLSTPKGRIADGNFHQRYGVWSWPYVVTEPTHWMPLPAAPANKEG